MTVTPAAMTIKEIDSFIVYALQELGFNHNDMEKFYKKLEARPHCFEVPSPVHIEFDVKGYHSEDPSLMNSAKGTSNTGIFYLTSDNNTGKTYTQIVLSLLLGYPWEQRAKSTFSGDPDYNDRGLRIRECIDNHQVSGKVSLSRGDQRCKFELSNDVIKVFFKKQADIYHLPAEWEQFRARMQQILETEFLPRDKNLLRISYNKIRNIIENQLKSIHDSVRDYLRSLQLTPEEMSLLQKISNIKKELEELNTARVSAQKLQSDWEEMALVVSKYSKEGKTCKEFLTISDVLSVFEEFHQELMELEDERTTHEQELIKLTAAKDIMEFELESLSNSVEDASRSLSSEVLKAGVSEIQHASTIEDVMECIRDIHFWPTQIISALERAAIMNEPMLPYTSPAIVRGHETIKDAVGEIKEMSVQAMEFNTYILGILEQFAGNVNKIPEEFHSQSVDDIVPLLERTNEILIDISKNINEKYRQKKEWIRQLREFSYFQNLSEDDIEPDRLKKRNSELIDELEKATPRISASKLLEKVTEFGELLEMSQDIRLETKHFTDFLENPDKIKDKISEQLETGIKSMDDRKLTLERELKKLEKKYEDLGSVKKEDEQVRVSKLINSLIVARASIEEYMHTLAQYLIDSLATETELQNKTIELERVRSDTRNEYVDLHSPFINTLNRVFNLICPVTFIRDKENKWVTVDIDSVNILDGTLSFKDSKGKKTTVRFADMGTGIRSTMTLLGLAGIPCNAPMGRIIFVDEKPESAEGTNALNEVGLTKLAEASELCCAVVSRAEQKFPKVELAEAP